MTSSIPAEIRERIGVVGSELYGLGGRETLREVDEVRQGPQVGVNSSSAFTRSRRKSQTAQVTPVALQVPECVKQASQSVLEAMWQQATDLANESLRRAQSAWDAERRELEDMRGELADAYDGQVAAMEALKSQLAERDVTIAQQAVQLLRAQQLQADAQARAELAKARAVEATQEVVELRIERDVAAAAAAAAREKVACLSQQLDELKRQLAEQSARIEQQSRQFPGARPQANACGFVEPGEGLAAETKHDVPPSPAERDASTTVPGSKWRQDPASSWTTPTSGPWLGISTR